MSQKAGMGWAPGELGRDDIMIVSTLGGLRGADGTPTALGLHTGHYELGVLVEAAARELAAQGALPYAASGRPLSASLTGPSPSSAPIGFAISSAARPRDSLCSSRSMKAVVDVVAACAAGMGPPEVRLASRYAAQHRLQPSLGLFRPLGCDRASAAFFTPWQGFMRWRWCQ